MDKKVEPKTESWEKRLRGIVDNYWLGQGYGIVRWKGTDEDLPDEKILKDFIRHEKQLSYQEAVEKTILEVEMEMEKTRKDEKLFDGSRTDDQEVGWNNCLDYLRHQLSILKGEKK